MEEKKYYKVGVLDMHNRERIFRLEAYSRHHAVDKVYTAFCTEVKDRNKYYIIKESNHGKRIIKPISRAYQ